MLSMPRLSAHEQKKKRQFKKKHVMFTYQNGTTRYHLRYVHPSVHRKWPSEKLIYRLSDREGNLVKLYILYISIVRLLKHLNKPFS